MMKVLGSAAMALVIGTCSSGMADAPSPVVDGHNHDAVSASGEVLNSSGLARLRSLGIDVVMVPLPVDRSETTDIEGRIVGEVTKLRQAAANGGGPSIVRPDELLRGGAGDRVSVLLSIEWFGSIFDADPTRVARFHDLGIRVVSFTRGDPDGLFGTGDRSGELSRFGERVVSEMNRVGVMIDITHLSRAQQLEIIRRSNAPVVATHSLVADVCPAASNLSREVVTRLAETNGSVWASFNSSDLLSCDPDGDPFELVVDHIEALLEVLGPDRVGIGTDLQAGGRYVPARLNQPGTFSEIARRLRRRGFSNQVVDGVLGRNILQALVEAEGIEAPGSTTR